jgi:hypothetical protein
MNPAGSSIRTNDGWFRLITRREAGWLVVGSLAFALVFLYPILGELVNQGPGVIRWITTGPAFSHLRRLPFNGDWDEETALRWVAYQTTTHFLQFPFWNPYKCGGMPMLGNPETIIVTPFLLLNMATGPIAGVYLQIVLHLALGFAGAYVLARVMGLGAIAGLVLGSVFLSCSWLYLQLAMGNLQISLPVAYWPWMLALFFVGIERRKIAPLAVGGIMLALTATEGNYTFVYAGILLALLTLMIVLTQRSIWPGIAAIVLVVFGGVIGAIKMLPVAEFLALHPRAPGLACLNPALSMIPTFLFSRNQDLYREIPNTGLYACYGAYVSPAFALLAVFWLDYREAQDDPMAGRGDSLAVAGARRLWSLLRLCDSAETSAVRQYRLSDALHISIRVCGWRACSLRRGFRLSLRWTMGSSHRLRTAYYRPRGRMLGGPSQSQIHVSRYSGRDVSVSSLSAVLGRRHTGHDCIQYGKSRCRELLWHGVYLVERRGIQSEKLFGRVLSCRTRPSY